MTSSYQYRGSSTASGSDSYDPLDTQPFAIANTSAGIASDQVAIVPNFEIHLLLAFRSS